MSDRNENVQLNLTKETILDCYFKEHPFTNIMEPFIKNYFFYFQKTKIQPENLNCGNHIKNYK